MVIIAAQADNARREISLHTIDEKRLHVLYVGKEDKVDGYVGAANMNEYFQTNLQGLTEVLPLVMKVKDPS